MAKFSLHNQLAAVRKSRGVSAADLARRVGVSRQTIYAIEAETYVPNTEVTLKLACELEVSVEDLFSLKAAPQQTTDTLATRVLSARPAVKGQAARLCRIGEQWVSVPASASPYYLPEADGVIANLRKAGRSADIVPLSDDAPRNRIVLAGCDPASSLLAGMAARMAGIEIVPAAASSKLALNWLRDGVAHIAGSHLEDAKTGDFNLPYLRREFPNEEFVVIHFANWEEGLVCAPGNPKGITKSEHLTAKNVRFINREAGSGSRVLLDRLLKDAGIPSSSVHGYQNEAIGHLAAAYAVVRGEADCCLATRCAANAFGLSFTPVKSERYDLVMHRQTLELPAVQSLVDILQRASLRRSLESLTGYDTRKTGSVLV